MPIRVAAVEDHPLMLKAITRELETQADIEIVGTAAHGSELQRLVRETSPDIVILDLGMAVGEFEPIAAVKTARQMYPNVQIMILTGYDDSMLVRELIAAGAQGYVLKSDDLSLCLPEGVRTIHRGGRFYSPTVTEKYFATQQSRGLAEHEVAILNMAARGLSNAAISHEMGLSEKTVRNYFSSIYEKLGIQVDESTNPRVAAINRARELKLLYDK